MPRYDVVIIGAGPAGATAARLLAKAGASVALVDREKFPREKCCAGWLSALAFKEFPELAARQGAFVECAFSGLVFHSPDLEATAEWSDSAPVGYQVSRAKLDAALVDMAREAGAEVILGEAASEITESGAGVSVKLASGRALEAKILIGADGANSLVARSVGLMAEIAPADMIGSINECFEIGEAAVEKLYGPARPIHVAIAYNFLAGYAWAFPKRSSVALGLGGKGLSAEKTRPRFKEFISDAQRIGLIPPGSASKACGGGIIPAGVALKAKSHVSRRTMLVGDAGGFVASASGEGIYPGMLSARIAAEVALKALAASDVSSALSEFNAAWRARMEKFLAMPNVNLQMMLPMIFSDKRVAAKFARAFLFGEKF